MADDDGTDQNGTPEDVSPNPEDANSGSGPGAFRMLDMPIEDELRDSYLTYAMSVIVSRALPDVRWVEAQSKANPGRDE